MSVNKSTPLNILAVDDNPTSLRLLESILSRQNFNVITAVDGIEALAILEKDAETIDVMLLDRIMPGIDGIEVCKRMKNDDNMRFIPVIMQTAASRPEEISQGIQAGVFYYLTKPIIAGTLLSIVQAAAKQAKYQKLLRWEMKQRCQTFGLVKKLECTFQTLEEGEGLATFLANLFPDPENTLTGISELLVNSIEHGNLDISYELKGQLVQDNLLGAEIDRRLNSSKYTGRKVSVVFERTKEAYSTRITDQGAGFDWRKYMEVDPSRAMHNHGRGIAMANILSFDRLFYNDKGNQVTGVVLLNN